MGGPGSGKRRPEAQRTEFTLTVKLTRQQWKRYDNVLQLEGGSGAVLLRRYIEEGVERDEERLVYTRCPCAESGGCRFEKCDVCKALSQKAVPFKKAGSAEPDPDAVLHLDHRVD